MDNIPTRVDPVVWDLGTNVDKHKEVRLAEGNNKCQGRVEVKYGDTWHTVCDRYFDHMDASVICYGLGCEHPKDILKGAHFGKGNDKILEHNIQCKGNESHLFFCKLSSIELHNCSHADDVGLICRGYRDYRLVNGSDHCSGRVELQYGYEWKTVCDVHWDLEDANVLCHQLNCGFAESTHGNAYFGSGDGRLLDEHFFCSGNESHLLECPVLNFGQQACSHKQDTGVICTGSSKEGSEVRSSGSRSQLLPAVLENKHMQLRLVNGGGDCAGRTEVYYNGSWGTVCDDFWDLQDANVVCKQLKCGHAISANTSGSFGKGLGPIWLDNVNCSGTESLVWECPSAGWGQHNCHHKEDAGAVCSEFKQLRLANGENRCQGRLEVFHNGTWGTVCSNGLSRNSPAIRIVCQQLSCGQSGDLQTSSKFGKSLNHKSVNNVNCLEHHLSLWQCPSSAWFDKPCDSDEEVHIICSDTSERHIGIPKPLPCNNKSLGMNCIGK
ncbi:scavenger receptor cysteine-rich type 1 protein M130-like [Protopterus annectens]|uniref:scavenger receptor cysteine-rich type 1 protein M130-like n=1 Tax=Protopterus annectens TaxID=7888 RepID=UPI001CFB1548|nr:scavenger receptor cysteine-rich type 1 protein M130-like [Protopterus annectens]